MHHPKPDIPDLSRFFDVFISIRYSKSPSAFLDPKAEGDFVMPVMLFAFTGFLPASKGLVPFCSRRGAHTADAHSSGAGCLPVPAVW